MVMMVYSTRGTHLLHITNLRMIDDPYVTHYYRNLWNIKYETAGVPLSLAFVLTKGTPHGISPPTLLSPYSDIAFGHVLFRI